MRLIEVKEDQGAVVADFEIDNGFFGVVIFESDGEYCLQIINNDGLRTRPVTHRQWFKLGDKIAAVKKQADMIGLNISKEELGDAVEIVLIRIENDPKLKAVLIDKLWLVDALKSLGLEFEHQSFRREKQG